MMGEEVEEDCDGGGASLLMVVVGLVVVGGLGRSIFGYLWLGSVHAFLWGRNEDGGQLGGPGKPVEEVAAVVVVVAVWVWV